MVRRRPPPKRRTRSRRHRRVVRGSTEQTPARFDLQPKPLLALSEQLDRLAKILGRATGRAAREVGASPGQLHVVAALARHPAGLTPKTLAATLAIRPGSLTGVVDTLASRGVVFRVPVPGDARQHRVMLSQAAEPLIVALEQAEAEVRAALAQLDDDAVARFGAIIEETERAVRDASDLPTVSHELPAVSNETVAAVGDVDAGAVATRSLSVEPPVAANALSAAMPPPVYVAEAPALVAANNSQTGPRGRSVSVQSSVLSAADRGRRDR